jgi:DNA-binding GntR family transcriptional regulator
VSGSAQSGEPIGTGWPEIAGGPPVRLGHRTYELIKRRLVDGQYAAGERLPVEALRAELGVSKQPVMEALRRLSGDGLVEIIPQVGCQVTTYTADEVTDFFHFFSEIEASIAEVAAARRTAAQLARLAAVSDQIAMVAQDGDPQDRARHYRILNREFHAVIHDMSHSRIMAEMSRRMWDLSDFLITTTAVSRPLHTVVDERHGDHERIRQALIDQDGPTARREMAGHIARTIGPS